VDDALDDVMVVKDDGDTEVGVERDEDMDGVNVDVMVAADNVGVVGDVVDLADKGKAEDRNEEADIDADDSIGVERIASVVIE
jgi:hypothetical protein